MRENSSRPSASRPNQWSRRRAGAAASRQRERDPVRAGRTGRSAARRAPQRRTRRRGRSRRARRGCGAAAARRRARGRPRRSRARSSLASISATLKTSRIRGLRKRVRDVDDQVDEHEHERDEEDPALQHGVVSRLDRLDEPGADPGPGKHGLGQHRTREQQARLEADDRRDRQQRVAEHVAAVDDARGRRPSPAPCARSPRSGRRARRPA